MIVFRLIGTLVLIASALGPSRSLAAPPAKPPNIVLILTDDQGYGDFSCHGNPILQTPNLDRLHDEGVRFLDFCVSPTCSPTRAALLTGRHEFRNGVTHTYAERERLAPSAITLAQVLQRAGYTTGIFGKWHLGDEPAYWPNRRGFDEMLIHGSGGIGQAGDAPGNKYFDPVLLHNGKFEKATGYCTDIFFTESLHWIESVAGKKPFFCYITTNAPHQPLEVRPQDEARYRDKVDSADVAKFYGMIANIDDNVGRLLDKLKSLGIERDTLVIFMNDNGGTIGTKVFNAGMRGAKVTPWLGGTRAASFWRWPGTLEPHNVDCLTAHIDVLPTLAELAGVPLTGELASQVEGRSLVPLLLNPHATCTDRVLFTHVGRWPKGASVADFKYSHCAVRNKRWQLVSDASGSGAQPQWQLFDLANDRAETTDVASRHPDVVRELSAAYDAWWQSVQPQLVNENAATPSEPPFTTLYREQFKKAR
jgi:arylsulfatase A-like enzyme